MDRLALEDDKDEKPLDPALERVRRKLLRFVAINLGLLFIALMAVVLAIVYKSRTSTPEVPRGEISEIQAPVSGGTLQGDILLPAGAKLLSQSLSGNHISLLAELSDGSQAVFLFDIKEGRIIGRFPVRAQ